jgi:hypothetical protein
LRPIDLGLQHSQSRQPTAARVHRKATDNIAENSLYQHSGDTGRGMQPQIEQIIAGKKNRPRGPVSYIMQRY